MWSSARRLHARSASVKSMATSVELRNDTSPPRIPKPESIYREKVSVKRSMTARSAMVPSLTSAAVSAAIADETGESLASGRRRGLLLDGSQGFSPGLRRDQRLGLQRLLDLKCEQFVAGLLCLQGSDGARRIRHQGAERLAVLIERRSDRGLAH